LKDFRSDLKLAATVVVHFQK